MGLKNLGWIEGETVCYESFKLFCSAWSLSAGSVWKGKPNKSPTQSLSSVSKHCLLWMSGVFAETMGCSLLLFLEPP